MLPCAPRATGVVHIYSARRALVRPLRLRPLFAAPCPIPALAANRFTRHQRGGHLHLRLRSLPVGRVLAARCPARPIRSCS
eukprot:1940474-Alexandrium_andersonii.AAC.1